MDNQIKLEMIDLEMIKPSPYNMRKTFDSESIIELSENIKKQGLIQPITVRPKNPYYEVVCGERRFRAFNLLSVLDKSKYGKINCIIKQMTDDEAFEAMITENIQRKDVDTVEEASAFLQMTEKGYSVSEIAEKLGKTQRYVLDRIKLNNLIPELKKRLRDGEIPITGAMLLSKLEESHQISFSENYKGNVEVIQIRRFIDNMFMILENTIWSDDDWEDGTFIKCENCVKNTANHGCLFYEMKTDCGKCTDRACFNRKTVESIIRKLKAMGDEVVKKDGRLEFGKSVVISDGCCSYWSDDRKELYKSILDRIKEEGYCVVNQNEMFKSKCWYGESDERIEQLLNDKEIYKCISFFNYSSPTFSTEFYYVKGNSSTSENAVADSKEIMFDKIRDNIKKSENKRNEHVYNAISDMMKKSDYENIESDLTDFEQLAMDMFVFSSLSYLYKEKNGFDYCKDDVYKFVKEHHNDRLKWYRQFILGKITDSYMSVGKERLVIQSKIADEFFPEDKQSAISKIVEKYDAKISKLNEQLKEYEGA